VNQTHTLAAVLAVGALILYRLNQVQCNVDAQPEESDPGIIERFTEWLP